MLRDIELGLLEDTGWIVVSPSQLSNHMRFTKL